MAGIYASYPITGGGGGIATYSTLSIFPPASSNTGTLAIALDTGNIYESFGGTWQLVATPSDTVTMIGTLDSEGTPSANGATITSNTLILQSASSSVPGVVNNTAQTFSGAKTFSTAPILSSLTASLPLQLDASKNIISSAIDLSSSEATGILAAARFPALTGDLTTVAGALATTLATVNSNTGTFASVTVNGKGLVTAASALSGDATTSGSALTLATVNSNVGSYTNATITVNAKGLITAASSGTAPVTSLTIASSNGFAGSSSGGATPAITLSTTVTGILQGNGTAISAASTTGSGNVVLATSPTLTSPALGTPSALVGTNISGTASSLTAGNINATSNATLTNLSALTTALSLASVGTITSGTWNGTTIAIANGGTGNTSNIIAPTATTIPSWDANKNLSANNLIDGYATTATAAGSTTLTVTSPSIQYFTGTTTQTVVLPVASTLVTGQQFTITNLSTGIVTVQSSGANTVIAQPANSSYLYTCVLTSGTTAASWYAVPYSGGGAVTPTVTVLTSGSGTFTTPANVTYIVVQAIGAGGGGSGAGSSGMTSGGGGGATTFGTSLITANGGGGGAAQNYTPSTGGSASVTTSSTVLQIAALTGGSGGGGQVSGVAGVDLSGASGGDNPFGGGGGAGGVATAGGAGAANTGGGGGGGGNGSPSTTTWSGTGGAAGGYAQAIITSPSSSYSYSVGTAGTAGTAGTNGAAGGAGGSGVIIITTYYNNGAVGTATGITGSVNSSQVLGTTAGGSAPSGFIGEFISANSAGVAVGSTGAFVTVTSISLTAGDWDVDGTISLVTGGTTAGTIISGGISLNPTSEDSQANGGVFDQFGTLVVSSTYLSPTGKRRINVSSTTTVYLVASATYTVAGGATWGTNSLIQARRVR